MTPSLRALAATLLLAAGVVHAQLQTIHTDHYRITFPTGTERTARRVAEVAEEVFPHLAAAFRYYDDYAPIHINVRDDSDFGNGSASDYTNEVNIWASNVDWEIRGEHDWIKNVLTHEIAHVITIDKARKKWPFRFALAQVSRTNHNPDISISLPLYYLNTPKWWVEGIAQMGPYALGWDTWDSHRDMILRMAVLEDDLHSYNEMGTLSNRTGGYRGEMVYNQGFGLLVYIADQYGRDKVDQFQEHVGFLSFEVAIRRVLGISAQQLYKDWVRYLENQYSQQVAEIRATGHFEGDHLGPVNGGVLDFHPAYSPDGRKLAYISSEDRDYRIPYLVIYDLETGEKTSLDRYVDTRVSWSPDGEEVFYLRNRGGKNDLYVYNLALEEEHRLSAGMRARDPHVSPDGERIVFTRLDDGNANLCIVRRDGTGLRQLTDYEDGAQIYSPRWSPDGQWLLFSIFRGDDRDIAMMRADSPPRPKDWGLRDRRPRAGGGRDLRISVGDSITVARGDSVRIVTDETRFTDKKGTWPDSVTYPDADTSGFRLLLATRADERDPWWLPDGSGFVFASDRTGVFNIYRHDLASGDVVQLTNVVGGAFTPTVAADGRVAYASYHANNFDLFELAPGAYERPADWGPSLARDYQTKVELPKLSEEYTVTPAHGRRFYDLVPLLGVGPTFIGNQFGLNQVRAGAVLTATNVYGGDLVAQAVVGKNFREDTDLNNELLLRYDRSLYPLEGNNNRFNPSMFAAYFRREVDFVSKSTSTVRDTFSSELLEGAGMNPLPVRELSSLLGWPAVQPGDGEVLVPDVDEVHLVRHEAERSRLKNIFDLYAVGVTVPVSRRHELSAQYTRLDLDEDWVLESRREERSLFVIQDSIDISESLPEDATRQDQVLATRESGYTWYSGLDFYDSDEFGLTWRYRNLKSTEDFLVNPTGRALTLSFRYLRATLMDSLTSPYGQTNEVSGQVLDALREGVRPPGPEDAFSGDRKPVTVNEYEASYTENLGLPYNNRLAVRAYGGYRNLRTKPSYVPAAGTWEGRFYWPLRYYLGGLNNLSGYPYFTRSGSKVAYVRGAYSFPVFRRLDTSFLNLTFAKLYAEVFAEAGMTGNFSDEKRLEPWSRYGELSGPEHDGVLADVGGELRLELFTNYRIPMRMFFQVAHPLSRKRLQNWEHDELWDEALVRRAELRDLWTVEGTAFTDADIIQAIPNPERPDKIDRFRYYFGLGFFPGDLLSVGRQVARPFTF